MWLPSLGLLALPESGQTGPGDSFLMSTHPHPCPSNQHHHAACSGFSKPCYSQTVRAGASERGLQATPSREGALKHTVPRLLSHRGQVYVA